MKNSRILTILVAFFAILISAAATNAQRRDYLTPDELELVRDAQEIDSRVGVLTHAIERRFTVINAETPPKEKEIWGPLPTGTRLQLLSDVQRLLQKAVDDIDNVAARDANSKLFPKAIWMLADACTAYEPKFRLFMDGVKEEKERGSILTSLDLCRQVLEAAPKVPREPSKDDKKSKKDDKKKNDDN